MLGLSGETVQSHIFCCSRTHGKVASKIKIYTVARPEIGRKFAEGREFLGRISDGSKWI